MSEEPSEKDKQLVSDTLSGDKSAEGPSDDSKKSEDKKPLKQRRADEEIKDAEKLEHKALDEKKAELEKLEKDIDKKRADLRKLISEAEHHGKSESGSPADRDTEGKQRANELLKGTGLRPYPEVE